MAKEHIILSSPMVMLSSLMRPSMQSFRWNGKPSTSILFSSTSSFKLWEKQTMDCWTLKGTWCKSKDSEHLTLIAPQSARTSGSVYSRCQSAHSPAVLNTVNTQRRWWWKWMSDGGKKDIKKHCCNRKEKTPIVQRVHSSSLCFLNMNKWK